MAMRSIIRIDEAKCNGCGNCITGCAEGALVLVNGKAKLVRESFCDGLGACIGDCPTGALTIEQREADAFDEAAVLAAAGAAQVPAAAGAGASAAVPAASGCPSGGHGGGCPGSMSRTFGPSAPPAHAGAAPASALRHWPVQLHLISPFAPQYQEADLLIAADCAAFACGAFHTDLLPGKALAIACPKLDELSGYVEKLRDLFTHARPPRVTVARMEVPCCGGLLRLVLEARAQAGSAVPVEEVVIGVSGDLLSRREF